MKRLGIVGIVGGIGPESTIEYYRHTLAEYLSRVRDGSAPSIVIDSIDVNHLLRLVGEGKLEELAAWLGEAVQRLAAAGARFGLIASNTPHIVFDEVQRASPIPLISIVEATCAAATAKRFTKVTLFGTRFTMQGRFYPQALSARGIELILPRPDEQAYVHTKYTTELLNNQILPETRAGLLAIARRLKKEEGIDALILAGTELSLILKQSDIEDLPILDTMRIHVKAAVDTLLG